MKKRIILGIAALVLVLSCAILPTFADERTLLGFLYDNRNLDVTLDNIFTNPTPDMVLAFPNTIASAADSTVLLFDVEDFVRVQYYDHRAGAIRYLNGYGSVSLSSSNNVYNLEYVDLYTYRNEGTGDDPVYLRYQVYVGAGGDYVGEWWLVNVDNEYITQVSDIRVNVYAFSPDIGGAYEPAELSRYGFVTSYPYISYENYYTGYNNGLEQGITIGQAEGYEQGKADGIVIGEQRDTGWMNFKSLIFAIFDAPFYVLSTALNFEVFGINIAGVLIGIITLAIVVFILKIVIVRLF